jgi:hypothetical protein
MQEADHESMQITKRATTRNEYHPVLTFFSWQPNYENFLVPRNSTFVRVRRPCCRTFSFRVGNTKNNLHIHFKHEIAYQQGDLR